jgi:sec-independent protein translocase protein TatC
VSDPTADEKKMPLLDHLLELRQRLLYSVLALLGAFLVAFFFAEEIFRFLSLPLQGAMEDHGVPAERQRMIFTGLLEVFVTYIKVSFFTALFVTCPVFLTQIWLFIAPGLYKDERSAFAPFLIASPILFMIGATLVYAIIFPLATDFLLGFEMEGTLDTGGLPIELEAKVDQYLTLLMKLIFAFGLCFQLPVLMTLLARAGLATSAGMAAKRKYAILGVFIVAAIFTPPDPLSQLSLAIPIILLYEISIYMAKLMEKKRAVSQAEEA